MLPNLVMASLISPATEGEAEQPLRAHSSPSATEETLALGCG